MHWLPTDLRQKKSPLAKEMVLEDGKKGGGKLETGSIEGSEEKGCFAAFN
jgi:hypothetical protein